MHACAGAERVGAEDRVRRWNRHAGRTRDRVTVFGESAENPSVPCLGNAIGHSVDLKGIQLFDAERGATPRQWYRSDGTAAGVQPLMTGLTQDHIYSAAGATAASVFVMPRSPSSDPESGCAVR